VLRVVTFDKYSPRTRLMELRRRSCVSRRTLWSMRIEFAEEFPHSKALTYPIYDLLRYSAAIEVLGFRSRGDALICDRDSRAPFERQSTSEFSILRWF
jgi:hypothetical protein